MESVFSLNFTDDRYSISEFIYSPFNHFKIISPDASERSLPPLCAFPKMR
jgi:hypothetical protein